MKFFLKVNQQIDDLCLDGDIQRGNRLIPDDDLGVERQCPGNSDSLPLSAAEFVGIAPALFRPQPDFFQQVGDPILALGPRIHPMDFHRITEDFINGHAGI